MFPTPTFHLRFPSPDMRGRREHWRKRRPPCQSSPGHIHSWGGHPRFGCASLCLAPHCHPDDMEMSHIWFQPHLLSMPHPILPTPPISHSSWFLWLLPGFPALVCHLVCSLPQLYIRVNRCLLKMEILWRSKEVILWGHRLPPYPLAVRSFILQQNVPPWQILRTQSRTLEVFCLLLVEAHSPIRKS